MNGVCAVKDLNPFNVSITPGSQCEANMTKRAEHLRLATGQEPSHCPNPTRIRFVRPFSPKRTVCCPTLAASIISRLDDGMEIHSNLELGRWQAMAYTASPLPVLGPTCVQTKIFFGIRPKVHSIVMKPVSRVCGPVSRSFIVNRFAEWMRQNEVYVDYSVAECVSQDFSS
jgi:hypothetical protein